ncbi:cytochrome c3 family protein [Geomesophilobacter sediminis]|uniref:Cytochrome c3 family protein n=1 Tax=Geomesophilobacter sediminis TaxID=2798584 RepID=A0A8J7S9S7_9BACT|nr:cytochrome c3 family protein [Geomesophilobacter sediminis]MBJ6727015.1 cytochrome c3 family protein [Geomesophilobacter sediminis]
MNKIIVAVALTFAFAVSAVAADTVVYPAPSKGAVTFNHKAHQGRAECKACHGEGAPSKITIDKNKAHELCKGCHAKTSGPTKCGECHKK